MAISLARVWASTPILSNTERRGASLRFDHELGGLGSRSNRGKPSRRANPSVASILTSCHSRIPSVCEGNTSNRIRHFPKDHPAALAPKVAPRHGGSRDKCPQHALSSGVFPPYGGGTPAWEIFRGQGLSRRAGWKSRRPNSRALTERRPARSVEATLRQRRSHVA